ncbi:Hpt domain-containing protein [Maridesulfovibrio frigidus]|uniref:Hpt domain-containing protein n=1 Tax=Maridesulfovibrio frigidus TaxID=340956 RepID=UPI0004E1200C|nr:Hpt domain-containing protein [Maridesulfovibrio frigidus]
MACEQLEIAQRYLTDQLKLNPTELDAFVKEVTNSLRVIMDRLDEAIDEGDFDEIIITAHTLKGSLANLGLAEMSIVAKNIELGAQSTTPAHLACYFMRLKRELTCLL